MQFGHLLCLRVQFGLHRSKRLGHVVRACHLLCVSASSTFGIKRRVVLVSLGVVKIVCVARLAVNYLRTLPLTHEWTSVALALIRDARSACHRSVRLSFCRPAHYFDRRQRLALHGLLVICDRGRFSKGLRRQRHIGADLIFVNFVVVVDSSKRHIERHFNRS